MRDIAFAPGRGTRRVPARVGMAVPVRTGRGIPRSVTVHRPVASMKTAFAFFQVQGRLEPVPALPEVIGAGFHQPLGDHPEFADASYVRVRPVLRFATTGITH